MHARDGSRDTPQRQTNYLFSVLLLLLLEKYQYQYRLVVVLGVVRQATNGWSMLAMQRIASIPRK